MQTNPTLFRCLSLAIVGVAFLWVASSCGSDDDPLAGKCEAVCKVDDQSSPCSAKKHVDECVRDCRALSGEAASKGYKPTQCGSCIAEQFYYTGKSCKGDEICTFGGESETCEAAVGCSADIEECFGAQQPTGINIPECTDVCIEVD